jgi:glucokinase
MIALGVDIGGTSIKFGLVDEKGQIIKKDRIVVDYQKNQEEIINELGLGINAFLEKNSIDKSSLLGIGIGCAGSISSKRGYCDYSNNLRWKNLNVCGLISSLTGLKAKISNDANVACLGEVRFGSGKQFQNCVMLTLGTGIGSGIVIDGKLYEGNDGKGAELGHELLKMNGRKCTCGRKGCLEAYASATALIYDTKQAMIKDSSSLMWAYCQSDIANVDGSTAFECSKKGDPTACKVIKNYVAYLGEGLVNICSIFRPECILIGGGVSNQKDYLIDKLVAYLEKNNYGFGVGPKVQIKTATLGADAGIIGAACLMLGE